MQSSILLIIACYFYCLLCQCDQEKICFTSLTDFLPKCFFRNCYVYISEHKIYRIVSLTYATYVSNCCLIRNSFKPLKILRVLKDSWWFKTVIERLLFLKKVISNWYDLHFIRFHFLLFAWTWLNPEFHFSLFLALCGNIKWYVQFTRRRKKVVSQQICAVPR